MACDGLLTGDILFDCDNAPKGGIEVNVLLINIEDIDLSAVTFDGTNKLLMTKPDQDEITKKRIKHRLKALHKISAYQSHTAAGNILFPGESLKKKVKSIIKKDIGLSYTKGIKIGNKSSQKDWMPK